MLKELPKDLKESEIEAVLKKQDLTFKSIRFLSPVDQQKAMGTQEYEALIKEPESKLLQQTMAIVEFDERPSFVKAMKALVQAPKPIEVRKGVPLVVLMHKRFGDYNAESSVFVAQLNPRCSGSDLISELDDLLKTEAKKKQNPDFVASCMVLIDPETKRSKQ